MKRKGFRVIVFVIMIALLASVVSADNSHSVNEKFLEQNTTFMNRNNVETRNAASNSNMTVELDIDEENEWDNKCFNLFIDRNARRCRSTMQQHIIIDWQDYFPCRSVIFLLGYDILFWLFTVMGEKPILCHAGAVILSGKN